jgi:hypothetical protein
MECRRWEETGLLYSVQELNSKELNDYEEHLKECGECRSELYHYRQEHKLFFTVENLGAMPSPGVDAEIIRVCSDCRKGVVVRAPALFPAFFRKAIIPLALLVIGFVPVGYIAMNVRNAEQLRSASAVNSRSVNLPVAEMTASVATAAVDTKAAADSLKDSLNGNKVNFAKTRGNLNGQGAIPVDLKEK